MLRLTSFIQGKICDAVAYLPKEALKSSLPVHWAAYDVMGQIMQSKDQSKVSQRFSSAADSISDVFRSIWPGHDVQRGHLPHKHSKKKKGTQEASASGGYTKKLAVGTDYMIAMVVWSFRSSKRAQEDRMLGITYFRRLVSQLVQTMGPMRFQVPIVGDFQGGSGCKLALMLEVAWTLLFGVNWHTEPVKCLGCLQLQAAT